MALAPIETALMTTAFQLVLVAVPVLVVGVVRKSKGVVVALLLTAGVSLLQTLILFTPNFGPFRAFQFNWVQKLLVLVVALVLPRLVGLNATACGYSRPKKTGAYVWAMLAGTVLCAIEFILSGRPPRPSPESVLFELTMPGLQEEFLYRGLLLELWERRLGRVAAVVITSALFTLAHLSELDAAGHLQFEPNPLAWLDFLFFCSVMCVLRYRFGSVWPAVVAHNASNGIGQLLAS